MKNGCSLRRGSGTLDLIGGGSGPVPELRVGGADRADGAGGSLVLRPGGAGGFGALGCCDVRRF